MAEETEKEQVRTLGEGVLRKKGEMVVSVDDEIKALVKRMIKGLYENKGIGLAAPQIGVSKQVTVIDTSQGTNMKDLYVLINPIIVEKKGEVLLDEGCLSLPGFRAQVKRAVEVKVEALNLKGQKYTIEATGLLAQALQHELDHLNGILFIDHLPWWQRLFTYRRQINQVKFETRMKLLSQAQDE